MKKMNKLIITLYTLWMTLLIAFMIAWSHTPAHGAVIKHPGPYNVQVIRVIDGDTFIGYVNVWPTVFTRLSIRINGIDTPESSKRFSKCASERSKGTAAKNWAKQFFMKALKSQSTSMVRLRNVKLGKYAGRVIADVEIRKGIGEWVSYSSIIIKAGYARPYFGKTKSDWCN